MVLVSLIWMTSLKFGQVLVQYPLGEIQHGGHHIHEPDPVQLTSQVEVMKLLQLGLYHSLAKEWFLH
jgi:hypothetical protein